MIYFITRREETTTFLSIALGLTSFMCSLFYQVFEARRLRRSLGIPVGPWLPTWLRAVLAVAIGVVVAFTFGGMFSWIFPRADEMAILFAMIIGTMSMSLTLLVFGMRFIGSIVVAVCWAAGVGVILGLIFGGIFRNEDAAIAIGIGAGILNFSLAVLAITWHRGRKLRQSSHRRVPVYGRVANV
jgi:hypothetical protein